MPPATKDRHFKTAKRGRIAAKIFSHASRQVSTNFRITPAVRCDDHQGYFLFKTRITRSGSPATVFGHGSTGRRKKSSQKRCVPGGQRMQIFSGSDWTQLRLRADANSLLKANQRILRQKVYRSGRRASVPNQPLRGSCTTGQAKVTTCQTGDMILPRGLHSCG